MTKSEISKNNDSPLDILGFHPEFEENGLKYDDYEYLSGHQPGSTWNKDRLIKGFHLDPILPDQFNGFPNEYRPEQEKNDWFYRPYIISHVCVIDDEVSLSFHIWCLDGGAWDRPTWKATVDDIEEALTICNQIRENYE